ncbi:MAG: hypothetical protein Q8P49_03760 [Candidatus Liptonbacteria bacterium]|nr:hypothetical protein [Candidatus Liptonbacteria bacterium]
MNYFYEATTFETKDGIHWKTQSNDHPRGRVLARPKYVPQDKVKPVGMRSRFIFGKAMTRFNPFAPLPIFKKYIAAFKKAYPGYIYRSPARKQLLFAVPENRIVNIHDGRRGLQEFLRVPPKDLDPYLKLVRELVSFLEKSGVKSSSLGISNSTLHGNYTFGRSDIDVVIYGIGSAWKIFNFLEKHKHPLLKWKTAAEWRKYYKDHKSLAANFSEADFVRASIRKRNEGLFGKHVFTLFPVERPQRPHVAWDKFRYESLGPAKVAGVVSNARESVVRPATYELTNAKIVSAKRKSALPLKKIVSYPLPFIQQARKGEKVVAEGELEIVTMPNGKKFLELVVGLPTIDGKNNEGYIKTVH